MTASILYILTAEHEYDQNNMELFTCKIHMSIWVLFMLLALSM